MSARVWRVTAGWCALLAIAAFCVSGCGRSGPNPVPVSGTVTIDGQPLSAGTIRVIPTGGRLATGQIGPDGRFTLGCFTSNDGCLPGTHKVEVLGAKQLSPTKQQWLAPRKYVSAATSGLTATIDGPTDALRINLTWAGSGSTGPFEEETLTEFRGGKRPTVPQAESNNR
jgi:hypothetical protein